MLTRLPTPSAPDKRLRQRSRLLDQVGERVFVQRGIERIECVDEDSLQPARRRGPQACASPERQTTIGALPSLMRTR